jgi:hypothetical protein
MPERGHTHCCRSTTVTSPQYFARPLSRWRLHSTFSNDGVASSQPKWLDQMEKPSVASPIQCGNAHSQPINPTSTPIHSDLKPTLVNRGFLFWRNPACSHGIHTSCLEHLLHHSNHMDNFFPVSLSLPHLSLSPSLSLYCDVSSVFLILQLPTRLPDRPLGNTQEALTCAVNLVLTT